MKQENTLDKAYQRPSIWAEWRWANQMEAALSPRALIKNKCSILSPDMLYFKQREPGASDEKTALRGISALEDFFRSIHMPVTLKDLGVEPTEDQILAMAASCAKGAGGRKGTAKILYEADMAEIYRLAR